MLDNAKRAIFGTVIRRGVRPLLTAGLSYPNQRRVATAVTSLCVAPRGMRYSAESFGGVPGERVTVGEPSDKVLLWLHGGGYCIGSSRTDRAPAGQFAQASGATVIVPDYRLAPEHPFPAALDDAVAVYRSLLDTGHKPANIAIGGDSAGGGLTIALAATLRDQGVPLPSSMVLCSPWVDLRLVQASYTSRAARDPWLTRPLLERWGSAYCGDTPRNDPRCSPLLGALHGLPPALIQVGEREILFDDAVELARKLRAEGNVASLQEYPEMWHVFFLQAGILREADQAVREIGRFVCEQWAEAQSNIQEATEEAA